MEGVPDEFNSHEEVSKTIEYLISDLEGRLDDYQIRVNIK